MRGRVQGVYFRDFTLLHARELGLVGWARNLPDGDTVEVLAEGPRPALAQLLTQLGRGPLGSHVVKVDMEWSEPECDLRSFEVR